MEVVEERFDLDAPMTTEKVWKMYFAFVAYDDVGIEDSDEYAG